MLQGAGHFKSSSLGTEHGVNRGGCEFTSSSDHYHFQSARRSIPNSISLDLRFQNFLQH